jgi:hypothetical protein
MRRGKTRLDGEAERSAGVSPCRCCRVRVCDRVGCRVSVRLAAKRRHWFTRGRRNDHRGCSLYRFTSRPGWSIRDGSGSYTVSLFAQTPWLSALLGNCPYRCGSRLLATDRPNMGSTRVRPRLGRRHVVSGPACSIRLRGRVWWCLSMACMVSPSNSALLTDAFSSLCCACGTAKRER